MNIDHLKASLKSLHSHLEGTEQVDEELQDLLQVLNKDIHQLLEKPAADDSEPSIATTMAERTRELTAKFAAQHPHLEPALRELGSILASMGI